VHNRIQSKDSFKNSVCVKEEKESLLELIPSSWGGGEGVRGAVSEQESLDSYSRQKVNIEFRRSIILSRSDSGRPKRGRGREGGGNAQVFPK
jgi:hypothetical protein